MQIQKLTLTNVRAFSHAEFTFQPGMNLLVGINGAGKSTVLDVLRIMLAQSIPQFTAARKDSRIAFEEDDITVGQGALTTQLTFSTPNQHFQHFNHIPRSDHVIDPDHTGSVRGQTYDLIKRDELTPNDKTIFRKLRSHNEQPFALFFSAHRSVEDTKRSKSSGQAAAFADALIPNRGLRLGEYTDWIWAQQVLADENNHAPSQRRLAALNQAITAFLDDCANLRAVQEPREMLLIDKGNTTLDVRLMSDGERSMLTLVLELARRLTQANPQLENPIQYGKAVVLIDELDLHLHPSWQRTIVERLTSTFLKCQFICTTHSPQIIGEVPPEQIILIMDGQAQRPNQSLGMDTNWILRHLMGVSERDTETLKTLKHIQKLIGEEKYDAATSMIDRIRAKLGEFPALVELQTEIDMIEFLADNDEEA